MTMTGKRMPFQRKELPLLLFAITVWICASWASFGVSGARADEQDEAIAQANSLSKAFRSAAKAVIPTVVTVRTTTKPRAGDLRGSNPFRGTPFEDLFDQSPGYSFRQPNVPLPGMGSGVIIGQGIVLTNNHVVEGADEVTIDLSDGRRLAVKEVKTDPQTDLAVLSFAAEGPHPVAKLGDSDELDIGDWVIAVGNPFELEQTVSAGIISAKGRSLGSVERARFLQTDAAINPGNSGGPLVNLKGEVIGINTAIFSRSGGYQGIGFAIPINLAKWVTPQLVEGGSVQRAYLGVGIGELTPERMKRLGAASRQGVVVETVMPDSPAERAGLKKDDVVLTFDGRPMQGVADLQEFVERSAAGSKHALELSRNGEPLKLEVTVEAMPEGFGRATQALGGSPNFHNDGRLGLFVMELSPEMAERLGFKDMKGALILNVDANRPAGKAGLRDGMLIRSVNGTPIGNVADYVKAMESASLEKGVTVEVQTQGGPKTVTIQSR